MGITVGIILLVTVGVLEGVTGLPEPRIGIAHQQIIEREPLPITIEEWKEIEQHIKEIVDIKIEYKSADKESTDNETTDIGSTACEPQSCDWVGGKQTGPCSRTPIAGYINTGQAECGIGCSCYILHPRPWVVDRNTTMIPDTELVRASGFECPRQNGSFDHEDPTNCEDFYECVNGIFTLHKCPDGLKFSEFLGYCDWAFSGFRQGCVDTSDNESEPSSPPNSTCGGPRIGGCGDGYCVYDEQPCRWRLSNCLCEAVGTFCCDGLPS